MDEKYIALKKQLKCLGYIQNFSTDSMPLVEKLTADLVQTTYSLQHYMNLSKEALQQKDILKSAAEPYKCDNAKLIQENNKLHLNLIHIKEDFITRIKELNSKNRELEDNILKLTNENKKIENNYQQLQLKNICAETISFSNKLNNKINNENEVRNKKNICTTCLDLKYKINEQIHEMKKFKMDNEKLYDKIKLLKSQLGSRENEIERLNKLLIGGRPLSVLKNECYHQKNDEIITDLNLKLSKAKATNFELSKQLADSLSKQHEAMSRAVMFADKSETLEKHLQTTDEIALQLESQCNIELNEKQKLIISLQNKLKKSYEDLDQQNMKFQKSLQLQTKYLADIERQGNEINALKLSLNEIKEKLSLKEEEISNFKKIIEIYENDNKNITQKHNTLNKLCDCNDNISKDDLLKLIETERKFYENQLNDIKLKLNNQNKINCNSSTSIKDISCEKLKNERDFYFKEYNILKDKIPKEVYVTDLQNKISILEHHIYELEKNNKDIEELYKISGKKKQEIEDYKQSYIINLQKDLCEANKKIVELEKQYDIVQNKLKIVSDNEFSIRQLYELKLSEDVNCKVLKLQQECENLRDALKLTETEQIQTKTLYNQLKALQTESDRSISGTQTKLLNAKRDIEILREKLLLTEKNRNELQCEVHILKTENNSLKENISKIDSERSMLVMDFDNKLEKVSTLQHQLRNKTTSVEILENKVIELNKKQELLKSENTSLEHKLHDFHICNEALSSEIDTITKQRDNVVIENKRLLNDLAAITLDLKSVRKEYENSREEVDEMKQQLQHYVEEVRRIEDILSRKEAERTEMLDQFASLSHEATILENNNHSLENETASKSVQLLSANEKIIDIERKLKSQATLVDIQEEKNSSLIHKISILEADIIKHKKLTRNTEQLLSHAQEMCTVLENQKKTILIGIGKSDAEKKNLEYNMKLLQNDKKQLDEIHIKDKASIESLETLLADSRKEVVELKITLQNTIEGNYKLKNKFEHFQKRVDIIENESLSDRQRTKEAAKQLQDLQQQMSDEWYQRVKENSKRQSDKSHLFGTL